MWIWTKHYIYNQECINTIHLAAMAQWSNSSQNCAQLGRRSIKSYLIQPTKVLLLFWCMNLGQLVPKKCKSKERNFQKENEMRGNGFHSNAKRCVSISGCLYRREKKLFMTILPVKRNNYTYLRAYSSYFVCFSFKLIAE